MKTSFANPPKKAPQSRGMSGMLRRLAARRVAQAMTAGALMAMGAHSASAQTTFAFGKSVLTSNDPTLTSPTALGALTPTIGATVEFIGPATINGAGNVTATGDFTTTTAGLGTGTSAPFGLLSTATGNTFFADYATVGLYDYAATVAGTPNSITGGSQITGFYSTTATGGTNFDDVTAGITTTSASNLDVPSIRFNVAQAEAINPLGGVTSTRGILVTPNVGANNITLGTGLGQFQGARNSGGNATIVIWQNNLLGTLTFGTSIGNSRAGTSPEVLSGIGTTNFNVANFYNGQTFINDGFLEAISNGALGTTTLAAAVNLKGGALVATGNFSLDTGVATQQRIVNLGVTNATETIGGTATTVATGTSGPANNGSGGVLAATTGNTLTVNGTNTITTAAGAGLFIGTGVLPGTGTGTANPTAVSGNGVVTITGTQAFTGPTIVNDGTLAITGSLTGSAVTVNGANPTFTTSGNTIAQTGGTLTGTGSITNALIVNGGGAVSLTGANASKSLTAGSTGGITLGSAGTFGGANLTTLNFSAGGSSGFETLNTAGALTLNSGGVFINITGVAAQGTFNLVNYGSVAGTGGFSFSPTTAGVTTETLGRNTFTLLSTATAEQVRVGGPAAPGVAYFDGAVSNNFNDTSSATKLNFSTDPNGTTTTANVPGANTDVVLTAANVGNPPAPAAGQTLTETLGGNSTINSLTVNANATSNTIAADGSSLTIVGAADTNSFDVFTTGNPAGNGITLDTGAGPLTIAAPVVVGTTGANQTWTNNSGSLFTASGGVSGSAGGGATQTLTLTNTGTGGTTISGPISNSASGGNLALVVNNSGTAGTGVTTVSSATNTFSGGTTVSGGTLAISNGSNLGTGNTTLAGGTIVNNFATGNALTLNNVSGTGTIIGATGGTGSSRLTINNLLTGGTLTLVSNSTSPAAPGINGNGVTFVGTGGTFVGTLNLTTGDTGTVTTLGDFVDNVSQGFNGNLSQATVNLTNFARLVEIGGSTGGTTTIGALSGDATSVLAGAENGTNAVDTIGTLNTSTEFDGLIGGTTNALSITKVGTGTLILANAGNNFTGNGVTGTSGFAINGGAVQFNTAGAAGTSTVAAAALVINAGGSVLVGNTGNAFQTVTSFVGPVGGPAGIANFGAASTGAIALTGDSAEAITIPTADVNLMLGAATTSNFTGTLTPAGQTYHLGGGGGTLTVNTVLADVNALPTNLAVGAAGNGTSLAGGGSQGIVVLSQPNTYTGTTTLTGANQRLRLTNTTGSATGSGAVNVTPTGGTVAAPDTVVLSGNGISTGTLTVTGLANNTALIAPGVNATTTTHGGVGKLTVGQTGGATLNTAAFDYDLSAIGDTVSGTVGPPPTSGTPNPANDQVALNNGATPGGALSLGVLSFNFNELSPTGTLDTTNTYTLISGASGVTTQTGFNTSTITTTFSGGAVGGPTTYTPIYNATSNGLTVQFAPAPEPAQTATLGLIALGMGGLFLRARKRRAGEKSAA